jgi:hypothetical protein
MKQKNSQEIAKVDKLVKLRISIAKFRGPSRDLSIWKIVHAEHVKRKFPDFHNLALFTQIEET